MNSTGWRRYFPAASYQYVLYGMGFRTEVLPEDNTGTESMATRLMNENLATTRQMRSQLPTNRKLLKGIYRAWPAADLTCAGCARE